MKNLKLMKRDNRIAYLYAHCGLSLEEIGKLYSLTKEGVRQIILKNQRIVDAVKDKDLTN